MSGFLCRDPLLAGVEAALTADMVRTLGGATLRARLDGDFRRHLVRVTGALLSLRSPSLRYGHGSLFSLPGASAGTLVHIGTACQAQPLAVGATQHECGNFQQPLFTKGWTQIDFISALSP